MNISNSSAKRLDPENSIKGLDQAFSTLDSNRSQGYTQLGQARSAKSASLAREQKLLAIKYGTTGTPRAQYAATVLTTNEQFRRDLAATSEVLEATAPEVDANSFVVYGFVRRKNQAGIPGLTLALTDTDGTWIRRFGYACTDKRGYFELRIEKQTSTEKPAENAETPKTAEEIKKEAEQARLEKEREAREAAAIAAGKTGETKATKALSINTNLQSLSSGQSINTNQTQSTTTTTTRTGFQLRVFNRDGRVLHIEQRAVTPKADTLDYRLIILDDDDCGCTPPPEKSDGEVKPSAPVTPSAPPPAPAQPATGASVEPRVANLKSYENPQTTGKGTPLEAIRGIGPKTANKLRAAGIDDVEEFEKTEGEKFVKLAGFDKTPPKPATAKPASTAKPSAAPAKPAASAPKEKKAEKKKSTDPKAKRSKK